MLQSPINFRKEHFFHDDFPMALDIGAGRFVVSFDFVTGTILNATGKPKTGF